MARPKKDIRRDRGYRIRLTEEEYLELKRMSEKTHLSMASVIRNAIKIYNLMIKDK